jgi:hypothetical protein
MRLVTFQNEESALEKFVEIAQDNLDEKRLLRNELQWQTGSSPNCAYCTLAMAMQPCPAALQKLYSLNNRP